MSMVCDACKQILDEDEGCAKVTIRNPMPDFSMGAPPLSPRLLLPQLDLCAGCLTKMVEVLGLPESTFRPKSRPAGPVGALSDADLSALGLKETLSATSASADTLRATLHGALTLLRVGSVPVMLARGHTDEDVDRIQLTLIDDQGIEVVVKRCHWCRPGDWAAPTPFEGFSLDEVMAADWRIL